jgi:predicted benzoate:H+ symporter BenE
LIIQELVNNIGLVAVNGSTNQDFHNIYPNGYVWSTPILAVIVSANKVLQLNEAIIYYWVSGKFDRSVLIPLEAAIC